MSKIVKVAEILKSTLKIPLSIIYVYIITRHRKLMDAKIENCGKAGALKMICNTNAYTQKIPSSYTTRSVLFSQGRNQKEHKKPKASHEEFRRMVWKKKTAMKVLQMCFS